MIRKVAVEFEMFMEKALAQAQEAYARGQFPVGCVIVQDNEVIATGARSGTAGDLSFFSEIDHAEIRALRALQEYKGVFKPENAVLYCTMEPCLMCFSAILLSGIRTVVYAYEDVMGGGTGVDLTRLAPLYRNAGMKVIPNVLRQKSLDLFYNFFNNGANLYWKDSLLASYTLAKGRETGQV